MKSILLLFFLTISLATTANEVFSYQLKKNQKFEKTFSVNINDNATIHLIIVKNKDSKLYDLIPFYMDDKQVIIQLETANFKEIPEIISYHQNKNKVTLVSRQNETLDIMDFDVLSGKLTKKSISNFTKPATVFIEKQKSIILFYNKIDSSVSIVTIKDSETLNTSKYQVPASIQKNVSNTFKGTIEVLNTNEYVENGSIANTQAYFLNNIFYFVIDKENENRLETIILNPNKKEPFAFKTYVSNKIKKVKSSNSCVMDNKLFLMKLGKEGLNLSIFDIATGTKKKEISLNEELSKIASIKNSSSKFLKGANKKDMKPTITVNPTKDDSFKITMNYVNTTTYQYYNNWFWMQQMMFQQQMMMNQQNMMNTMPSRFGPNPDNYLEVLMDSFIEKTTSFSFILNDAFEVSEYKNQETTFKFVDKEKYLKSLSDNKNIYNSTIGFLEDEFHYMFTNKKENTVYILTKKINRRTTTTH